MWQDEAHFPLLEQKLVKDKMAKFHQDVSSIECPTCTTCMEKFPGFKCFFLYLYIYVCQSVCLRLSMGNPYKKMVCQNAWAELRGPNTRMLKFCEFETKCRLETLTAL